METPRFTADRSDSNYETRSWRVKARKAPKTYPSNMYYITQRVQNSQGKMVKLGQRFVLQLFQSSKDEMSGILSLHPKSHKETKSHGAGVREGFGHTEGTESKIWAHSFLQSSRLHSFPKALDYTAFFKALDYSCPSPN